MPDSALDIYLKMITNKEMFLKKLSYSNKRRQFDRAFYSILGLLDGAIGFGVIDRVVLDYISNCVRLNDLAKDECQRTINQINYISNDPLIPVGYIKCNTRAMKFFLLLSSLGLVDFTQNTRKKLQALGTINDKLSSFSSAKADSVQKAFYGYSEAVINELRLVALISKGGQTFKRVKNRMEMLAYYINDFENKTTSSGIIPI